MGNDSYARTAAGMFDTLNRRLTSVERRLPPVPYSPPPTGGTTAARNTYYGTPATDAERVALANQAPLWNNSSTGWMESYYAVTGLAGLTVFGLTTGAASGWYPVGRADYAIAAKRNGYQQVTTSALIDGMTMIRDRGSINLTSNRLVLPRAGEYQVTMKFYITGGYSSTTIGCSLSGTTPDGNNAGGLPSMVTVSPANNADITSTATRSGILASGATVGLVLNVNATYAGIIQVYGDASNAGQGTTLEIVYVGPPLADG